MQTWHVNGFTKMETTITCKRCKECGALIAPTSILCPECEKRLMRKPAEANPYVEVSRRSDGTYTFDDSFIRHFVDVNIERRVNANTASGPRVAATNEPVYGVAIDSNTYDWS